MKTDKDKFQFERYCSVCGRQLRPHDENKYTCNVCLGNKSDLKNKTKK
jgi:hypothetical protein